MLDIGEKSSLIFDIEDIADGILAILVIGS